MGLSDIIVIYLACGAPFAVYYATRTGAGSLSRAEGLTALLSLFVWPVYAINLVAARISSGRARAEASDRIRLEIESSLFADQPLAVLFEFREVFYRYTGLAGILRDLAPETEGISISGSGRHAEIARRCHARRNRHKLEIHRAMARGELIELMSNQVGMPPSAAQALADYLADPIGSPPRINIIGTPENGDNVGNERHSPSLGRSASERVRVGAK